LAMEYAVREPRIASTLFSSTRAENVRANLAFIAGKPDPEMLLQVREILGNAFRLSWKNT
ncbi:MAG: aldo/keto reductase, partial [Bacteroidales bacterium]|nr:aldo/keto reductase [Bacteroidales bacterium]